MSYVKGSQLPSTSTVADTDTLIVTQEGDSKATKKVAKSDLLKEDRTRLTNLETDNTTNKNNITNLQQENQTLKNNVKALEYVINNSNRLNYTGEIITNSNSAVGDIRNVKVNGNTRYKKSDGTYTDTWESGVSLESMGEKEKNSNGKYPVEVVSCGKNLFSTELLRKINSNENCNLCSWNEDTEVLHLQWNGKETYPNLLSPKVKKNTQYAFSFEIQSTTNTAPILLRIKYTDGSDGYSTDKLTTSTEYQRITIVSELNKTISSIFWIGNNNTIMNVRNLQLEKGTTATTYEAYKEDKRTVLLDSPLRKNDVLDLEKLKITRNYGSATFNGEEEWAVGVEHTNTILFDKTLGNSKPNYIMCDKFIYNTSIWGVDTEGCRISNNGSIQINISKSKLETQDVAGFKKWLQSNPVTVVYQLATPITEDIQISPTDNPLTSYTPSTTLTTNNTIKGNISADMPTNLSGVITQQASLIAQLEDNLLQTQALLIDNVIDNT